LVDFKIFNKAKMEKNLKLHEEDRKAFHDEIQQCQSRVLQTLVPTILALGLIAVADPENIGGLSLGCAFAVLFSSSLYVASLSFKIFRNASFLDAFSDREAKQGAEYVRLSDAISYFNAQSVSPTVLRAETSTAALIYLVLAVTFGYIFYSVNLIVTIICTVILLSVSIRIIHIYKSFSEYKEVWKDYIYEKKNSSSAS